MAVIKACIPALVLVILWQSHGPGMCLRVLAVTVQRQKRLRCVVLRSRSAGVSGKGCVRKGPYLRPDVRSKAEISPRVHAAHGGKIGDLLAGARITTITREYTGLVWYG